MVVVAVVAHRIAVAVVSWAIIGALFGECWLVVLKRLFSDEFPFFVFVGRDFAEFQKIPEGIIGVKTEKSLPKSTSTHLINFSQKNSWPDKKQTPLENPMKAISGRVIFMDSRLTLLATSALQDLTCSQKTA